MFFLLTCAVRWYTDRTKCGIRSNRESTSVGGSPFSRTCVRVWYGMPSYLGFYHVLLTSNGQSCALSDMFSALQKPSRVICHTHAKGVCSLLLPRGITATMFTRLNGAPVCSACSRDSVVHFLRPAHGSLTASLVDV